MKSIWILMCAAVALGGCCCTQSPACDDAARDPFPTARSTSAWLYMAAKHDKDGDGAITAEEYGRGEKAFANLDRDGDGKITKDEMGHGPIHQHVVKATLLRYFQTDERPMDLKREELKASFAAFDTDADAVLSAKEFSAARDSVDATDKPLVPKMVGGMDVYRSMRIETGSDQGVELLALMAYFERMTAGAGVISIEKRPTITTNTEIASSVFSTRPTISHSSSSATPGRIALSGSSSNWLIRRCRPIAAARDSSPSMKALIEYSSPCSACSSCSSCSSWTSSVP